MILDGRFNFYCHFADDIETSITEVHHKQMEPTLVDGYQAPGSYVRPIEYPITEREHWDAFIDRAGECEQSIAYRCWNSKLLADSGKGWKLFTCSSVGTLWN